MEGWLLAARKGEGRQWAAEESREGSPSGSAVFPICIPLHTQKNKLMDDKLKKSLMKLLFLATCVHNGDHCCW